MKRVPVASVPVASAPGASLLCFYRDALDKLALWRLTECDPAMQDAMREVADDLLSRCAVLTRKMRASGLLDGGEKMQGLRLVDNRGDNRQKPGS
jgi:hypothetical protein